MQHWLVRKQKSTCDLTHFFSIYVLFFAATSLVTKLHQPCCTRCFFFSVGACFFNNGGLRADLNISSLSFPSLPSLSPRLDPSNNFLSLSLSSWQRNRKKEEYINLVAIKFSSLSPTPPRSEKGRLTRDRLGLHTSWRSLAWH